MKIVSKEEFMKVWKDTSREGILNQFYYDYKTLREEYEKWNELKKWLEEQEQRAWDEVSSTFGYVLNKMQELEGKSE